MPRGRVAGTTIVAVISAGLGAMVAGHLVAAHIPRMTGRDATGPVFLFGVLEALLLVAPPVALGYGAVRFREAASVPSRRPIVGWWCLAGVVVTAGAVGAVKLHQVLVANELDANSVVMEMLTAAGFGGVLGLLAGQNAARARHRAEVVAEQRDDFAFLNRLLRHHVLNAVTVIDGYADRLADHVDDAARGDLSVVRRRAAAVASLVGNVEAVSDALAGTMTVEAVDLVDVVRTEVRALRDEHPGATIEVTAPDQAYALANPAVAVVVNALLSNAVEHHDGDPTVEVRVRTDGDEVRVRVADDGPGLSAGQRRRAFEAGDTGDSGFGLYLVRTLVDAYGGDVDIADRDPRGTAVTVALPRPGGGEP